MEVSKEQKKELISYFQDRPFLVKTLARVITALAYVASPFYVFSLRFKKKLKPNHFILAMDPNRCMELMDKIEDYEHMMKSKQDGDGFIEHEKCDSLLFTGLVGSVGIKVNIDAAHAPDGKWHRRPVSKPCYPHGSASTISRDMLLGLMWYIWRNKRLDIAVGLFNYGKNNNWIMGDGDPSRTFFTPGLQATLAEIIFKLRGPNFKRTRALPQVWTKGLMGYQAHLQALHVALRGELDGYITEDMLDQIVLTSDRLRHKNPFLLTIIARFREDKNRAAASAEHARSFLLSDQYFPDGRLPRASDRSARWIAELDTDGWKPDPDDDTEFSGGDLVFIGKLVVDYFQGGI